MRSISRCAVLFLALSCSGEKDPATTLREFANLEGALNAISTAPADERRARLKDVIELQIDDQRVREVRARCVKANEAFLDANARMGVAKKQVSRIEQQAEKALAGPVDLDASINELSNLHASAVEATTDLDAALDRAEALVRECTRSRAALTAKLNNE